ncbi:MAG: hypothetical protein IPN29_19050 [Saprospiraceae bacterium]|nr:hypothetical protein [Saprospiraceae bacterium]
MKKNISLLYIFLLINFHLIQLFAQPTNSYTKNIVLPSAEVSSLGKYADVPVDNFTGVPQIEIPIHTVKSGSLNLPISLSYHASGLVVSQVSSRIGAGWSLNAGGMISRTVLGLRDEGPSGYYYNGNNIPLPNDCGYNDWVINAGNGSPLHETEPDLFSFNIGGVSGKFYFSRDFASDSIIMIPLSDVKIVPHFQGNPNLVDNLDYFTIINTDGTKYYLGKYNGVDGLEQTQFSGSQNPVVTAWYVVRIESADTESFINFSYAVDNYEYQYRISKSSYTCVNEPEFDFSAFKSKKLTSIVGSHELVEFLDGINRSDLRPHYQTPSEASKALGTIKISTGSFIKQFDLTQSHWQDSEFPQVSTHLNYLLRLDAIQEKGFSSSNVAVITNPATTFEYTTKAGNINFFPNRISKAIDHWGYYNGKTTNNPGYVLNIPPQPTRSCYNGGTCANQDVIPANYTSDRETHEPSMLIGSLKRITYPTGGSTELVLEANDYHTSEYQTPITELIRVDHAYPYPGRCNTSYSSDNVPSNYTFATLANVKYTFYVIPAAACSNSNLAIEIILKNANTNAVIANSGQMNFTPGSSNTYTANLSSLFPSLPLNTAVKFEILGTNCAAQFKVFSETSSLVFLNKKVGGLRVKTITQKDGGFGSPDVVTNFEYKSPSNSSASSATLFYQPKYYFTNTWFNPNVYCQPPYNNCGQCSNGIQDGMETGVDCGGNCVPCSGGCHVIFTETPVVPLSSFEGYHIGYSFVDKKSSDNSYTRYEYFVEPPFILTGTYLEDDKYPIEPHQARINTGKLKVEQKISASGIVVEKMEEQYKTDDIYSVSSDRMMKVGTYTICNGGGSWGYSNSYHIRTKVYRLSQTRHTLDNVIRVTDFTFDPGNRFYMPVSESITNSDGKVHRSNYTYIHDYPDATIMTVLRDKNIISSPFKTMKLVNGILVDGTEIEYAWFNIANGSHQPTQFYNQQPGYPRTHKHHRYEYTWTGATLTGSGRTLNTTINNYDGFGNPILLTVDGWQPITYEWFSNSVLKKVTFKDHIKQFTYYPSTTLLNTATDIDGQVMTYEYDELLRLKSIKERSNNVISNFSYHYKETSGDVYNWVKTTKSFTPTANSSLNTLENKEFVDGLGRGIQFTKVKYSPLQKDIVVKTEYDAKGRVSKVYNPVESTYNNGTFYTISGGAPFTLTTYEDAPTNRKKTVTPPSWYASTYTYGGNTSTDVTNLSTGSNYAANLLNKTEILNPDGNRTLEFTDKLGRKVMDWNTNVSFSQHARTYTMYDDKSRITKIVPPGGTLTTNDLNFDYTYDQSDNILSKKIPAKAVEKYMYNTRDLKTFFQDGVMLATNDWIQYEYDDYGRPTQSGKVTMPNSTPPGAGNVYTYNDVYAQTSYFILPTDGVKLGKLKQQKDKVLGTTNTWIDKTFNYDTYGRISSATGNNYIYNDLTAETISTSYDFADNVMTENRTHKQSANSAQNTTFNKRWTYDHSGRQTDFFTTLNGGVEQKIANQNYTIKDELLEKNLGAVNVGGVSSYLQSLDYQYNDQGWITKLNQETLGGTNIALPTTGCTPALPNPGAYTYQANPDPNDLFYIEFKYDTASFPNITGLPSNLQKAGNIAQIAYRVRGRDKQAYNHTYDFLNRMLNSTHYKVSSANAATASSMYNENLTYDSRGNVVTLNRQGYYTSAGTCAYNTIDNLTYNYSANTNKLNTITESASATYKSFGFNPGAGGVGYTYDVNGNLKSDSYKGITNITYNFLNLPSKIEWGTTKSIDFVYSASGEKLAKTVKTGSTINYIQHYVGGIEYNSASGLNRRVEAIYHGEGRFFNTNTGTTAPSYRTEFSIKDHLGNARVTFTDLNANGKIDVTNSAATNEIIQENHYYAFGMAYEGPWMMNHSSKDNNYLYNYKELNADHDLKWYDYGARFYDAVIGRWHVVDPLADKYPKMTPYNYVENNPIRLIDPDGRAAVDAVGGNPIKGFFLATGAYLSGVANAVGSNSLLGAGRQDPSSFGEYASYAQAGQTAGDVISVVQGGVEMAVGASGTVVATGTGVGVVATPATVGLAVHGATTTGTAMSNLLNPSKVQANSDVPKSQLGPSGKPKIHTVSKPTLKEAKDAARNNPKSNSQPVKHSSDKGQKTHFHSAKDGKKLSGKDNVHYENRSSKKNPNE